MNREIRFRVWTEKEFKEPPPINEWDSEDFNFVMEYNQKGIWQQYTGLKDKNGKEIYVGDLIKINGKYTDRYDGIYRIGNIFDFLEWYGWLNEEFCIKSDNFEIIGNIFENEVEVENAETI